MRGLIAFTKKELLEQLRTYKWLILLSVYFLFGMTSPLLAKLMPEIFAGMKVEGMQIIFPEPTVIDAYAQFFKNMTQMGILVLLLVFGSTLTNELMRGTLVNILAKGLSRSTVIISKYMAAVVLWSVGYLLAVATNYGYTSYLFPGENVENLIFSLFCLWLFGCFILVLIILSSTITGGNFGGLILSAAAIVLMLMVNILPNAKKFNPITLASENTALVSGITEVDQLISTVMITLLLILGGVITSILLFHKKRL